MHRITKISTKIIRKTNTQYPRCFRQYRYSSNKSNLIPPKKKHTSGTLYTIGFVTLAGGGTIAYAKYDPHFRAWLNENVPYSDEIIKFICQEDQAYLESIKALLDYIKESFMGLFGSKKKRSSDIPVASKDYCPPAPAFASLAESSKEDQQYTEIRVENVDKGKTEVTIGGDVKPIPEIPTNHPKYILELEKKLADSAGRTVQAYNEAVCSLRNYSKDVELIIEDSTEKLDPEIWNTLRKQTNTKNSTIHEAEKLYKETKEAVKELEHLLKHQEVEAPNVVKLQMQVNIKKIQEDLEKAKEELHEVQKELSLTDKYWNKVESARNHFIEELQILFPGVDIKNKQLNLKGEEFDLFVLHAFSNITFYQKELCKLQILEQEKLKYALENARRGNSSILTDAQIEQLVEKERKNLALEFQKKCFALRVESEKELRNQLKIQSETFHDHLRDAITTNENQLKRNFARDLDEKVAAEKCKFQLQLAAMVGRIKAMDELFKARTETENIRKRAQLLWGASHALFKSLRASCPGLPWTEQLRPLEPEITSIKNAAADGDELVKVVLAAIPPIVKERGVYPEDALRERFVKVEKVARDLSLIPAQGARLPYYFLSFMHSLLLIKAPSPIPQAELEDDKVDFRGLTTNEILQRARYWIDRGNFAQTLRYMNLLDGASRVIASQWMHEARLLLETQQAANVLMAHASASALSYM